MPSDKRAGGDERAEEIDHAELAYVIGDADSDWWQLIHDNHGSGRGLPGCSEFIAERVIAYLATQKTPQP